MTGTERFFLDKSDPGIWRTLNGLALKVRGAAGVGRQKLALLPAWRETEIFTDRGRAALTIGEAVTVLPDDESRQAQLQQARALLRDEQYSVLQWAAVAINAFNRVSIMSRHPVRARG